MKKLYNQYLCIIDINRIKDKQFYTKKLKSAITFFEKLDGSVTLGSLKEVCLRYSELDSILNTAFSFCYLIDYII